ncbi:MAG: aspartate carbamoyltransferase [Endozoicomonadaceae bacterium]|nr:aspartate carbamoyltransferase [Endozoicomonadaceae bacterium]
MQNQLFNNHILSLSQFDRMMLEDLIQAILYMKTHGMPNALSGKVIGSCFMEPSTRTRLSFDVAIKRLGGHVIGFDNNENTSSRKGESLSDMMCVISSYVDAIILRHPKEGSAYLASQLSSVPIINAGDGSNQHPTQTVLDLFSIYESQNTLDGLTILCVGDLKYGRTVHSLIHALSYFKVQFIFVAPEGLQLPQYLIEDLDHNHIAYEVYSHLEKAIPQADIIYMTRIQQERLDDTEYQYLVTPYLLKKAMLKKAKSNMKILHPLPRLNEIELAIDHTPFAYYFQQATNGMYARMALLTLLLNKQAHWGTLT